MREREQPAQDQLGDRDLPVPGQYTSASMPRVAPEVKLSAAAWKDIWVQTGRSSSASIRRVP